MRSTRRGCPSRQKTANKTALCGSDMKDTEHTREEEGFNANALTNPQTSFV